MFERFTERARRVIVQAQQQARLLDHNYIGTEHLLLGMLSEGGGIASQALESLGVTLESARREVEGIIGRGQAPPTGHVPFTPRAKKVLELSLREALQLGHDYLGTEHLLLGLIREGEGVAIQVLDKLGANGARVREQVRSLLGSGGSGGEAASPGTAVLSFDLTRALGRARDAAVGREHGTSEVEHLLLALLDDERGMLADLLRDHGTDLDALRAELKRRLDPPETKSS